MAQTLEAVFDETGNICFSEPLEIKGRHRVLVTVLEEPSTEVLGTTLLSESCLASDWDRVEEDDAWLHLQ